MEKNIRIKQEKRSRRKARVAARVSGTSEKPRLAVYRSLKHFSVQLIDDQAGKTIAAAADTEITAKGKKKVEIAFLVGELIAKKALGKKIGQVVFDRSSYKYHGRVKAAAEGARKGGLRF